MKKKILAMLLATGMLVGLLAGCGGGTTESAKTSESEPPASNQAEAPVTEEQSAAPAQEPALSIRAIRVCASFLDTFSRSMTVLVLASVLAWRKMSMEGL